VELPAYIRPAPRGVRLDVFVQPKAGREGTAGIHGDALKLKVRAPAQDGKANRAVLDLLSDLLDVRRGQLEITSGHSSRSKRVLISGVTPEDIASRVRNLLHGYP